MEPHAYHSHYHEEEEERARAERARWATRMRFLVDAKALHLRRGREQDSVNASASVMDDILLMGEEKVEEDGNIRALVAELGDWMEDFKPDADARLSPPLAAALADGRAAVDLMHGPWIVTPLRCMLQVKYAEFKRALPRYPWARFIYWFHHTYSFWIQYEAVKSVFHEQQTLRRPQYSVRYAMIQTPEGHDEWAAHVHSRWTGEEGDAVYRICYFDPTKDLEACKADAARELSALCQHVAIFEGRVPRGTGGPPRLAP